MSIPEPKFAVGERVMIRSASHPEFNRDDEIVESMAYKLTINERTGVLSRGWAYHISSIEFLNSYGIRQNVNETSLRKRPEPGQDWESLRDSLKLPQVETA